MNTGVILLVHRHGEEVDPVAGWYLERLEEKGHRNVRLAYHEGSPSMEDVLRDIRVPGVNNTVVVLPLLVSEGNLSVWRMPKGMGMPDNSCSFTYITGTHIAIRFSTAFDRADALSEVLLKRLKEAGAGPEDGVLLIHKGSELAMSGQAAEKHAQYIRDHGFPLVECNSVRYGKEDLSESVGSLKKGGARRIVMLPMFMFAGESVRETIPKMLSDADPGIPVVYAECLGCDDLLFEEMDRKIPEDW